MSQYDCQQIMIWNLSDPTLGVISWTKCLSPLNYILSIFMDTHTLLSGIMDNFEDHDRTIYMTKGGLCCSYIILSFKCSIHTGCSFHTQLRGFPIGSHHLNKIVRYTIFYCHLHFLSQDNGSFQGLWQHHKYNQGSYIQSKPHFQLRTLVESSVYSRYFFSIKNLKLTYLGGQILRPLIIWYQLYIVVSKRSFDWNRNNHLY